jgi:hypothetical protein
VTGMRTCRIGVTHAYTIMVYPDRIVLLLLDTVCITVFLVEGDVPDEELQTRLALLKI